MHDRRNRTSPNETLDGLSITSFRFASTQRKFDRETQKWIDGDTNWYSVATFRQLATNVVASVQKGQRLIITGRLRVRDWAVDDKHGTNVEIDAEAVGHDLSWGTTIFTRSTATAVVEADAAAENVDDAENDTDDTGTMHSAIDGATTSSDPGEARLSEPVGAPLPF